jgi:putative copper resistance protein D
MECLLILSRAIHFGSCLVLLSVFVVRLLIEWPSAPIERPAADDGRAARLLAGFCLGAAAGSGFVWLWASAAGMSGSGMMDSLNLPLFQLVLGQTPPGHVWILRAGIAVALAVLLCFPRGGWRWVVGLLLAAALVGSLAWLGHAGASEDRRSFRLTADVAHLLAASVWPAGLFPFALLLRRQMKAGALPAAYANARRFSAVSLLTVSVLAASGLVNAYFLVGGLHALVGTGYGRLLIVKLTFFAIAVVLGAWNLLVHEPSLQTVPTAPAAMLHKVWIEAALGALIVSVVALMGILAPASHP